MRIDSLPIWERIERAGLLEQAQTAIVRAEVATWKDAAFKSLETATPDPTVMSAAQDRLIEWLVSHELMTRYQGQVLIAGHSAPLEIGPLKLMGQVRDWGLPHHYGVVAKRPTDVAAGFDLPQALAVFGERLLAADWSAIQRRVERLAAEKSLKSPHLLVPWGSVVSASSCAVLTPPGLSAVKSTEPSAMTGSAHNANSPNLAWTFQSLAQRLAPEFAKANPAPSAKRVLQWALDLATGLSELHERDLTLGFWDPASVLITANKRAVLLALPGVFLRTPFLASVMFDGAPDSGDANSLLEAISERVAPNSPWLPLDFLAPEIVERLDQTSSVQSHKKLRESAAETHGWATAAADMYCLGRVLFGQFKGSEGIATETLETCLAAKRQPPAFELPATVPSPIRSLVERLMSPDPLQRPGAPDVVQSLCGLLKQSAEPLASSFVVSAAAKQLQQTCRQWPGACWTKEVDAVQASELPELIKTVEVPAIVIQTSNSVTESEATGSPHGGRDNTSENRTHRPSFRERQRPRRFWSPPIVACFVSGIACLVVLIWWVLAGPTPVDTAELDTPNRNKLLTKQMTEEVPDPQRVTGWNQEVVPDDGRLLWESPTVGIPLEVSGLPNNPSGLLVLHQDF